MKRANLIILLISIIFFVARCGKSSTGGSTVTDPCLGLSFKFAADVQPIFNSTCSNSSFCHGTNSTNSGGPLTDYNKIFLKRSDIKGQINAGLMPRNGSLTADQKNKIICWIDSGAPNN